MHMSAMVGPGVPASHPVELSARSFSNALSRRGRGGVVGGRWVRRRLQAVGCARADGKKRRQGSGAPRRSAEEEANSDVRDVARQYGAVEGVENSGAVEGSVSETKSLLVPRDPHARKHVGFLIENSVDRGREERVAGVQAGELADVAQYRSGLRKRGGGGYRVGVGGGVGEDLKHGELAEREATAVAHRPEVRTTHL